MEAENPSAVRKALAAIQPNAKFKPLYDAAVGRQRADWLYGLNMTRLYTVLGRTGGYDGILSVGRVQTPLLGLIVRRDLEIEKFVPKPYFSILADVAGAAQPFTAVWRPGADAENVLDHERRLLSADFASLVERKTSGQSGTVTKAACDRKAEAAPLPYSLADLQVDAGRRLGLGPKVILDVCQALYETHRLTTYPRSDCSYLPEGHLAQAGEIARAIASIEPRLADAAGGADLSLRSRAFNDAKVTAHHALIPTPRATTGQPLSKNERDVYNLIARRYLAQFFPPFEYFQLDAEITVAGQRFTAKGRQPIVAGWKRLFDSSADRDDHADSDDGPSSEGDLDPESPLPPLQPGEPIRIANARTVAKKTKPPKRFTAAGLVQAMTGIANYVSNPQIKALLRETDGIGTPATQASIIQRLFDRHFIEEQKRQIVSTPTARSLIAALPDVATQPDMTALWEASLRKISEGQAPLDAFLEAVRRQLGELVARARSAGAAALRLPAVETRPCRAPGCAGVLRKRTGKTGVFWACTRYPNCKATEPASTVPVSHQKNATRQRHRLKVGLR